MTGTEATGVPTPGATSDQPAEVVKREYTPEEVGRLIQSLFDDSTTEELAIDGDNVRVRLNSKREGPTIIFASSMLLEIHGKHITVSGANFKFEGEMPTDDEEGGEADDIATTGETMGVSDAIPADASEGTPN